MHNKDERLARGTSCYGMDVAEGARDEAGCYLFELFCEVDLFVLGLHDNLL